MTRAPERPVGPLLGDPFDLFEVLGNGAIPLGDDPAAAGDPAEEEEVDAELPSYSRTVVSPWASRRISWSPPGPGR